MTESNQQAIEEFDTTVLVRIAPKDATLPIHTAAEWNKGFSLINVLIKELADHRYIDEFEDSSGNRRTRPMLHPQLLAYIAERRKMIDQIFKVSGGEAVNELKKETAKKVADYLFQIQMDKESKEKYKKEAYDIIEAEVSEHGEVENQSE